MCEVSKCEFRLSIDVLFVLFSWDSSLHNTTSFTNGGREKWRFQGIWSGTGRIMKQKLPVLQRLSYVVYLNSEYPNMDPNTVFLAPNVTLCP